MPRAQPFRETITITVATAQPTRAQTGHITVFLDVDGVLNSFPVEPPRFRRERRKAVRAWHYELHYRPKIVKGLERLVDGKLADIVWLSTWSQRCSSELEPAMRFKHSYPVISMPDSSFNRYANDPSTWWKARAVESWLQDHPQGRAAWIDDDLAAPVTSAYFSEMYGDRLLLVAPEFTRGLTEQHLADIRAFSRLRPADEVDKADSAAEPAEVEVAVESDNAPVSNAAGEVAASPAPSSPAAEHGAADQSLPAEAPPATDGGDLAADRGEAPHAATHAAEGERITELESQVEPDIRKATGTKTPTPRRSRRRTAKQTAVRAAKERRAQVRTAKKRKSKEPVRLLAEYPAAPSAVEQSGSAT